MSKIRVLVVEDEPLYRNMLELSLSQDLELEITGSFGDAEEALEGLASLDPDVATLDIQLEGEMNGFDLGLHLRQERPQMGIVLLSSFRETAFLAALRRRQLVGWSYLLKQSVSDVTTLQRAVKGVARGEVVLDPSITASLHAREGSRLSHLTPRQREVLGLVAEGYSNSAIADQLSVTLKSVENRINQIFRELDVDNSDPTRQPRVAAVLHYLRETRLQR